MNVNNYHDAPCGLYVHIPFCHRKCLYCSFAIVVAQSHRMKAYVDALLDSAKMFQGRVISSVYWGGGTPSALTLEEGQRLMQGLREIFKIKENAQFSMEVNPEDVNAEAVRAWQVWGFHRFSLGVQSFNDEILAWLGRNHRRDKVLKAIACLREQGVKDLNVDLMFGFPNQSDGQLDDDLFMIKNSQTEHVSLYTLTVEPKSRFYVKGVRLDDPHRLSHMYLRVREFLEAAGYHAYEISNFAKPGFECRHNQGYWQGEEYVGLGMGAHGYVEGKRFWFTDRLQQYLANPNLFAGWEVLDPEARNNERLCFALRTSEGADLSWVSKKNQGLIDQWCQQGFLYQEGYRLKATLKGQLVLDELSARLI